MEQVRLTEEMLKSAFQSLSDELVEEWENGVEKKHEFSERFERKMKVLIRKEKGKERRRDLFAELHLYRRPLMVAASAFLICIIFFASSMTARANPMLYFKKIEVELEDSSMYFYDEDLQNYRFYPYEPTYIPEGYTEVNKVIKDDSLSIYYCNEQGEIISWSQILITDNTIIGINTECKEKIETEYAGEHITIYILESGFKSLYYESGNCVFTMGCDNISLDDMYEMIKEMKPVEKN